MLKLELTLSKDGHWTIVSHTGHYRVAEKTSNLPEQIIKVIEDYITHLQTQLHEKQDDQ